MTTDNSDSDSSEESISKNTENLNVNSKIKQKGNASDNSTPKNNENFPKNPTPNSKKTSKESQNTKFPKQKTPTPSETPRNSLSQFRVNKLQTLEKNNAELVKRNRQYEQLCYQLKKDLEALKAERKTYFQRPQTEYETDEEELANEIGETTKMDFEPSCSKTSAKQTENWTTVPHKKRNRESIQFQPAAKKQTTQNTYWLGNETVFNTNNNIYSALDTNEDITENEPVIEYIPKPPPIFVDKVENIQPLYSLLKDTIKDDFTLKILRENQVKILPKSQESYSKIVKQLESKHTEFFTYKPKEERGFRVILRNMHPSTNTEELKKELSDLGHEVKNIWNIKRRGTKLPLSLFDIELKTKPNNKEIYAITDLMYTRISFEPPRPKKQIPQCSNCQQYGHTKSFCRRQPKCIKCAGNHPSMLCSKQNWSNEVKCVLCNGNHPANYKGCSTYKDALKLKYQPHNNRINRTDKNEVNPALPKGSYANVARNSQIPTENRENPSNSETQTINHENPQTGTSSKQSSSSQPPTQQMTNQNDLVDPMQTQESQPSFSQQNIPIQSASSDTSEVITLLKALSQQMATVTNLLISLLTKFN